MVAENLFELAGAAVPEGSHLAAAVHSDGSWEAAAVTPDHQQMTPLPALDRALCAALAAFIEDALRQRPDGAEVLHNLAAGTVKLLVLIRPTDQIAALDVVPIAIPDGLTRH